MSNDRQDVLDVKIGLLRVRCAAAAKACPETKHEVLEPGDLLIDEDNGRGCPIGAILVASANREALARVLLDRGGGKPGGAP